LKQMCEGGICVSGKSWLAFVVLYLKAALFWNLGGERKELDANRVDPVKGYVRRMITHHNSE
jgi:hypothetical protein